MFPSMIILHSKFITTARTWASLFRCRYIYNEGKGYALSSQGHSQNKLSNVTPIPFSFKVATGRVK